MEMEIYQFNFHFSISLYEEIFILIFFKSYFVQIIILFQLFQIYFNYFKYFRKYLKMFQNQVFQVKCVNLEIFEIFQTCNWLPTAIPKSLILSLSSAVKRIFAGFISLWYICFRWRKLTPSSICVRYFSTELSGRGWLFCSLSASEPPSMYSMTIIIW